MTTAGLLRPWGCRFLRPGLEPVVWPTGSAPYLWCGLDALPTSLEMTRALLISRTHRAGSLPALEHAQLSVKAR